MQQGTYEYEDGPTADEYGEAFNNDDGMVHAQMPANRTIISKIRPILLSGFGSSIKLELQGPQITDLEVQALYIGNAAASGNAWDAAAVTQITVGGSGAFTLTAGEVTETDAVSFAFDPARAFTLAGYFLSGAIVPASPAVVDAISFYKDGVNEVASAARAAGYTPLEDHLFLLRRILVA